MSALCALAIGAGQMLVACGVAEPELPVEGYLLAGSGTEPLRASADALSLVGIDGVNLTTDGAGVTAVPDEAGGLVAAAGERDLSTELLFGNFDEGAGDFSAGRATKLLSSAENRAAVVASLVDEVEGGGFDGVQVDMESLDATHADGLSLFLAELREALPEESTLSMALMAADTADGYADEGYDLDAIADPVGRFVLMAYDQHGPTWTDAGPIGGTPWVEDVLSAFIDTGVPAEKVDLGVAEYAYTWPADGTDGEQLSVADARDLAGDAAVFDDTQQEWTATLADGTVVWWSDDRTREQRAALAVRSGIHGLAVWELGLADPIG